MDAKFFLYIFVIPLILWSIESVNINQIFKKNRIIQARVFYLMIALSLSYLVTNFIYDFFLATKFV